MGRFLMIDGPDLSGKKTAVDSLASHLKDKGLKVFSLHDYWHDINSIPEVEEIRDYDVIISAEPTFSMVGRVIREEIVRNTHSRRYSGLSTAQAFALDREILYRKLLMPARKLGKTIIQERGVITSLVYQPVQLERMNLSDIMALPGNRLALQNPPDALVILRIEPAAALERMPGRDKQDQAIFENLVFQRKIQMRSESDWIRKVFPKDRTRVFYIDTNPPSSEADTAEQMRRIWKELQA